MGLEEKETKIEQSKAGLETKHENFWFSDKFLSQIGLKRKMNINSYRNTQKGEATRRDAWASWDGRKRKRKLIHLVEC